MIIMDYKVKLFDLQLIIQFIPLFFSISAQCQCSNWWSWWRRMVWLDSCLCSWKISVSPHTNWEWGRIGSKRWWRVHSSPSFSQAIWLLQCQWNSVFWDHIGWKECVFLDFLQIFNGGWAILGTIDFLEHAHLAFLTT